MKKEIKTIYYNYKLAIMEIEDTKEIYSTALLCIYSNSDQYDIQEIIVALKGIGEIFCNILDSQKEVISILSNNELIPDYFLISSLIMNHIFDKIYIFLNLLENNGNYENKILLSKTDSIFDLTDHLSKNLKYIFNCIEILYYELNDEN